MESRGSDPLREQRIQLVDSTIERRRTFKVLATEVLEVGEVDEEQVLADFEATVLAAVKMAHWAPFHYPGADGSAVPWHFLVVDRRGCNKLASQLEEFAARESREVSRLGKIPALLRGTLMLVLVTWKAEASGTSSSAQVREQRDREHLAATAAAVQTFLVAAAARGLETYWSSGGVLARQEVLLGLGATPREVLCAAVFVAPREPVGEVVGGKLRDRRGEVSDWLTRVDAAQVSISS